MKLHLGGHLSYFDAQSRSNVEIEIGTPMPLADILTQLGIPFGEIYLVIVNSEIVPLETTMIEPGDKVEVFPPMGGG